MGYDNTSAVVEEIVKLGENTKTIFFFVKLALTVFELPYHLDSGNQNRMKRKHNCHLRKPFKNISAK